MFGLASFLLKFFISSRRGLILLGLLLVLGGGVSGIASHQVTYRNGARGTVAHYLSGDSAHTGYLQMGNSSNLYYVNENDFTPMINENGVQTLGRGSSISYVYTPDETEQIDETATDTGAHLQGTAFRVVQITLYDQNGQHPDVFTSSDYAQNPQGYYQNNWPAGMSLLVLGLLVTGVALFWPTWRAKRTKPVRLVGAPWAPRRPAMGGQLQPAHGQPFSPSSVQHPQYQPYQHTQQDPQHQCSPQPPLPSLPQPAQYSQEMDFSCTDCGATWSRGQWSASCRQCGGGALEIACPLCQGRCGRKWKRSVVDSWDYRQAYWGGVCGFRSFSKSPTQLQ
jgi:hypothetical protein